MKDRLKKFWDRIPFRRFTCSVVLLGLVILILWLVIPLDLQPLADAPTVNVSFHYGVAVSYSDDWTLDRYNEPGATLLPQLESARCRRSLRSSGTIRRALTDTSYYMIAVDGQLLIAVPDFLVVGSAVYRSDFYRLLSETLPATITGDAG